jgi:hypothetical protein
MSIPDSCVESNHFFNLIANEIGRKIIEKKKLTRILKLIITEEHFLLENELLSNLNWTKCEDLMIVNNDKISGNLRHYDKKIDRILHQMKSCVIDSENYFPLFYVSEQVKYSFDDEEQNSFISDAFIKKDKQFIENKFESKKILSYDNHIGEFFVIFSRKGKWFFFTNGCVFLFSRENNIILHEHINDKIDMMDPNLCYHITIVDSRLKKTIHYPNDDTKYCILIKVTDSSLKECKINNNPFYENKILNLSSPDHVKIYINEQNSMNIMLKKLLVKGIVLRIKNENEEDLYLRCDTKLYEKIKKLIPIGLPTNTAHLFLYQNDKLNDVLMYIEENFHEITKRINNSMSTISREILDIYHKTRNLNNCDLYSELPYSYKKTLYELHNDYIKQKHMNDNSKISISVDHVYNKLKKMDTLSLVNIYLDRDTLSKRIMEANNVMMSPINNQSNNEQNTLTDGSKTFINKIKKIDDPIRECLDTKIQTRLFSIEHQSGNNL